MGYKFQRWFKPIADGIRAALTSGQRLIDITFSGTTTTITGPDTTEDTLKLKGSGANVYPFILVHGDNSVMVDLKTGKIFHVAIEGADIFEVSGAATSATIYGPDPTGADLTIAANKTDTYPKMKLNGAGYPLIYYPATKGLLLYDEAANTHKLSGENSGGHYSMKEMSGAPTATGTFGALYTKADNKLYFQDGAGAEHEVAFVP